MRGRKPKPTTLHEIQGTLNATRHADRKLEPQAEGHLVAAPDWMTDSQKAGWDYAVEHAPRGVLRLIDRTLLVIWVEAEDRHRTAAMMQAKVDVNTTLKLLSKTAHGIEASPYLDIMSKAAAILIKCASEMGFTPASRPRIKADGGVSANAAPAAIDKWAKLKVLQGGAA